MGNGRRLVMRLPPTDKNLRELPDAVKKKIGFHIGVLQDGEMLEFPNARQMRGFSPEVIELRETYRNVEYRVCVTVRLAHRVYILHVFKHKAKEGSETPKEDLETIASRLKTAVAYDERITHDQQGNG